MHDYYEQAYQPTINRIAARLAPMSELATMNGDDVRRHWDWRRITGASRADTVAVATVMVGLDLSIRAIRA